VSVSAPSIRELFLGLYGRLPKELTVVSIIRACIDETYSHDNRAGEPFMVTGCVSTLLKWEYFDRRWRKLLKHHKLKRIHFYEIWQGRGEFDQIRGPQLVQIVEDFETTIFQYVRFGFSTVLYPEDFARFKESKGSNLHTLLDSDYGVSIRVCYGFIDSMVPGLMNDPRASIYVLVEDGHANEGAVWTIFREYQKTTPEKDHVIKHAALVSKDQCYGTQAADMRGSAYLMEERAGKQSGKPVHSDFPPELKSAREFMANRKLPWFRLPINEGVLTELRDSVILSRPKFIARYGDSLSPKALASLQKQPA
jgi:hypothetical protein